MKRVSRKRTTRNDSPAGSAESEQRTTKNTGYGARLSLHTRHFPLPALSCGLSSIFSLLPPDAYAWRFLSSTFRFRQPRVVHFQLFAACRLRMAFFVVDFLLSATARRSFSAFCRLTRTRSVFCRRLFASGNRASFIFSLLPPDAYARRFSLLVFRLRQLRVVHFQLSTA